MTELAVRAQGSCIGSGVWTAQVTGRGGSPVRFELPYTGLSLSKVLNASGTARIDVPTAVAGRDCCEIFRDTQAWKDEVVYFRDDSLAHVGPVQGVSASLEGGTISTADLFAWMEVRFLEDDFHGDGDLADIFASVFDLAYSPDESPNISISSRQCGVDGLREFQGDEFRRAADVMRELARTGLDFTMDGRRLLAGGTEVFLDAQPLILHDEGVISAEVTREGSNFATDVAVFGSNEEAGGVPITGRATRSQTLYGLVQRSFTELTIADTTSADANALARLEAMHPAPLRVKATLSPEAAFGFGDLICGRRVDVRLYESSCITVDQFMRLTDVSVNVSVSEEGTTTETVEISLVPLGVSDVS